MSVTETRIRFNEDASVLAEADVTLDYSVVIRGFSIRRNAKGCLYVNFPQYKNSDGRMSDIVYSACPIVRSLITNFIIKDFERLLETVKV
ncbi:MAG: septation protein SpoVG family protein [Fibrobacterota bacterium]